MWTLLLPVLVVLLVGHSSSAGRPSRAGKNRAAKKSGKKQNTKAPSPQPTTAPIPRPTSLPTDSPTSSCHNWSLHQYTFPALLDRCVRKFKMGFCQQFVLSCAVLYCSSSRDPTRKSRALFEFVSVSLLSVKIPRT